jgi:ABC-2 type transport system ATP-binding protein
MDPAPIVTLKGVTKWFNGDQVLKGVDLDVPEGSVTVLLGRNGCGKSTTMRIVAGLVARDGGQARVLGRDPEALRPEERERLAYVTDSSGVAAGTVVADELALHARTRRGRWNATLAKELLERFEVPPKKTIGSLSKGLQTRLRLVLAVAAEPELLLLDEPALGLDLFGRHDLLEAVIDAAESRGRAVLLATHLIEDVERVADRIAFVREGAVPFQGTTERLRDAFRRTRFLVGNPDGSLALERAAAQTIGIRRVFAERDAPPDERVVIFDGAEDTAARLEQLSGAKRLETRRMTLKEIYFEVLSGREEVTA